MNVVPIHKARGGVQPEQSSVIAVLDVGSTKICCLIAEVTTIKHKVFGGDRTKQLKILGLGHQVARGTRNGSVVDMIETERAIRLAVDAAERMAGQTIESVYVNVSGGRPHCKAYRGKVHLAGREVSAKDVDLAIRAAQASVDTGDQRVVLHTTPTSYNLDEA